MTAPQSKVLGYFFFPPFFGFFDPQDPHPIQSPPFQYSYDLPAKSRQVIRIARRYQIPVHNDLIIYKYRTGVNHVVFYRRKRRCLFSF
jgi:hypothetical protein